MKFEKKFIIFSFTTFFVLQLIFILITNYNLYKEQKHFLFDSIKKKIEICSYRLNCKDVKLDFVLKIDKEKLFELLESKNSFYMLFKEPQFKRYLLRLSLNKKFYFKELKKLQDKVKFGLFIEIGIIIILSLVFTLFLFIPLKAAYKLNETFIKDILHDFNTPLSSLKLNLYLLQKEIGENKRIDKLNYSIAEILSYQENLKHFLNFNVKNKEKFNLKPMIDDILEFYSISYPSIKYENRVDFIVYTNKIAMKSILQNLISNAFKYNIKNGFIKIYIKQNKLYIQDSGVGIKNPHKVFDRFYKENERGIGIGMSIVKKLCDELKIDIQIVVQNGTTIILDLIKISNRSNN